MRARPPVWIFVLEACAAMSDSMQTAAVHACGVNVLMSEGVNADEDDLPPIG